MKTKETVRIIYNKNFFSCCMVIWITDHQ